MRENFDYSGYGPPGNDPMRAAREALEARRPYRRFSAVRPHDERRYSDDDASRERFTEFSPEERERYVPAGRFEQNPWDAPRGERPYDRELHDEHTWPARASHAGRGPRGYARSDARIHEDVSDRLFLDRELDARDIEVLVSNGCVVLEGHVDSPRDRRRADDLTHAVPGVTEVHNHLRITRP